MHPGRSRCLLYGVPGRPCGRYRKMLYALLQGVSPGAGQERSVLPVKGWLFSCMKNARGSKPLKVLAFFFFFRVSLKQFVQNFSLTVSFFFLTGKDLPVCLKKAFMYRPVLPSGKAVSHAAGIAACIVSARGKAWAAPAVCQFLHPCKDRPCLGRPGCLSDRVTFRREKKCHLRRQHALLRC